MNTNENPICRESLILEPVEDYYAVYEPMENRGILVVDQKAVDLLKLCDGVHSQDELSQIFGQNLEAVLKVFASNGIISSDLLLRDEKPKKKIYECWFHITNGCNLRCSYCYIHKDNEQMDINQAKKNLDMIINGCIQSGIEELRIKFSGGEPLLCRSLIEQLIHYIQCKILPFKVRYGVLSNGTLITEDVVKWLKKYSMSIAISLDGVKTYNDKTRLFPDNKSSYDDVINGIKLLKKENYPIAIMTTISSENLRGLPELTRFLCKMQVRFRYSFEKSNECFKLPTLVKNSNELINILNECVDIMIEELKTGNTGFHFSLCDIQFNNPRQRICGAGKSSLAIDHRGKVALCGMGLANPIADIEDVDNLYEHVRDMVEMHNKGNVDSIESCRTCTWRYSCASGCPLFKEMAYGQVDKPSPYCEVFQAIIPRLLKLEGMLILKKRKKEV